MTEARTSAEAFAEGLKAAFKEMKPKIIIRKYDRRGHLFYDETAESVEDARALIQQAQEAYDSDKEARAELHCIQGHDPETEKTYLGVRYGVGYCQHFRDWESVIENFDIEDVFKYAQTEEDKEE